MIQRHTKNFLWNIRLYLESRFLSQVSWQQSLRIIRTILMILEDSKDLKQNVLGSFLMAKFFKMLQIDETVAKTLLNYQDLFIEKVSPISFASLLWIITHKLWVIIKRIGQFGFRMDVFEWLFSLVYTWLFSSCIHPASRQFRAHSEISGRIHCFVSSLSASYRVVWKQSWMH